MSISKAEYMLKYQKAKVKLLEYNVPEANYPKFPLNYRDLAFPTVLTLSEYSDAVIRDNEEYKDEIKDVLYFCSEYYDAAMKSREQKNHDIDFLLTGAASYFFQENFGSAMVLLAEVDTHAIPNDSRGILVDIFELIFHGRKITSCNDIILDLFDEYLRTGNKHELLKCAREKAFKERNGDNEIEAFFSDITCAVIIIALNNSARKLLPIYTGIDVNKWTEYFQLDTSIKMIWPAQKVVGEKGFFMGKSGIVQLPTGVGKTKSIELLIRSLFLSGRGKIALIIAPLRALCNEITDDMKKAFSDNTNINQFSDLLEMDFEDFFQQATGNTILICTPEKLQYILHHRNTFLSDIDLFIFDEGHMFDDMNRGALYELLIERIKNKLKASQQMVLLSAVLPNANEILEWIAGKTGALAYDKNIQSTPKVIGFASGTEEVHYYSNSFTEEDFYVPGAITKQKLIKKSNREKIRVFPENNAQDIALYFSNKLCTNGGVAIYMSQRRSIPKLLQRLLELDGRGCSLRSLSSTADKEELQRFNAFITLYYGSEYVYSKASLNGILPHYSSLPNGLRLAVEYAFRKGLIKVVACTSTLAQGVNIPIKYLIMTSLRSAQGLMSSRNLQNLIGRTARSGVYTEGSIIISDPQLYDQRNNGKGFYEWEDAKKIFQSQNAEACGSAILSVVQPFPIDYQYTISGKDISTFIVSHISEDWAAMLKEKLAVWLKKKNGSPLTLQMISSRVDNYRIIIGNIENEICRAVTQTVNMSESPEKHAITIAMEIYEESLAKTLATEEEQLLLKKLFMAVAVRISALSLDISKIGISMVDVDMASKINNAIEIFHLNDEVKSDEELLQCILQLNNETYPSQKVTEEVCTAWILGEPYWKIADDCSEIIPDIEMICSQSISYQLSFLTGNVIDHLSDKSANTERLGLLQKKIKYGVSTITAISICEQILNDRMIATLIVSIIGDTTIQPDKIVTAVCLKKDEILDALKDYPTYFADRINALK